MTKRVFVFLVVITDEVAKADQGPQHYSQAKQGSKHCYRLHKLLECTVFGRRKSIIKYEKAQRPWKFPALQVDVAHWSLSR